MQKENVTLASENAEQINQPTQGTTETHTVEVNDTINREYLKNWIEREIKDGLNDIMFDPNRCLNGIEIDTAFVPIYGDLQIEANPMTWSWKVELFNYKAGMVARRLIDTDPAAAVEKMVDFIIEQTEHFQENGCFKKKKNATVSAE